MLKWLYNHGFKDFIDYDIVGEYYDRNDKGHLVKKYNKKYYIKRRRK